MPENMAALAGLAPGSQNHTSTVKKKITKRLIELDDPVIALARLQLFLPMLEDL